MAYINTNIGATSTPELTLYDKRRSVLSNVSSPVFATNIDYYKRMIHLIENSHPFSLYSWKYNSDLLSEIHALI